MNKKNIKKLVLIGLVFFVLWFVFFASAKVQATIIAAFGYLVSQIIIVSCSVVLVIWFYNKKKK